MNEYLTDLGGEDKKWLILGMWTFAAAAARPFSGKIADNISRKSVMYFGVLVSVLICFLYPVFMTVTGFLVLRFFHGFSTGFHPTGVTALIADIIPKGKRGEAMGLFGVTISIGFSGGQALGSPIKNAIGIEGLFIVGGVLGALSLILLFFIKEKRTAERLAETNDEITTEEERIDFVENQEKQHFWGKVIPKKDEIIAPEVLHPSVIMFLTAMCSGIYLMAVPDFSAHLGMENKGMFYMVNVTFMIVTRFMSGKFYDKYGARRNLNVGLTLMMIGAIITGTSTTVEQFLFSSIVFGIASSICSPALFAWTADLANPIYKGRGMSTMFIALEIGIVSGTFMTQRLYDNNPANFIILFSATAGLCVLGVIYLSLTRRNKIATNSQ